MVEELTVLEDSASKSDVYVHLLKQIEALIDGETSLIANLANISAALAQTFHFLWIGFYLVDTKDQQQLVVGPFQGPIACSRIKFGKGVCGASWAQKKAIVVPDVEKFPGHIACSSASKSEIVVPIFHPSNSDTVVGVLDVDSTSLETFDSVDEEYLVKLCSIISSKWQ